MRKLDYEYILRKYYKDFLNRGPDPEGFSYYLPLLETVEMDEEQLRSFMDNPRKSLEKIYDFVKMYDIFYDTQLKKLIRFYFK
jgi:hypothetical protein